MPESVIGRDGAGLVLVVLVRLLAVAGDDLQGRTSEAPEHGHVGRQVLLGPGDGRRVGLREVDADQQAALTAVLAGLALQDQSRQSEAALLVIPLGLGVLDVLEGVSGAARVAVDV